jgi:hypothetical protein
MRNAAADQGNHSVPDGSAGRRLIGAILRICVPALLWTTIAVAAPAFISQIRRGDRAIQEDFAAYYYSALGMRDGVNPYTTDFTRAARASGLNIHGISRSHEPPTFLVLIEPLTHLRIRTAYWVWQATNLTCLAIAMVLLIGPGAGLALWQTLTLAALATLIQQ